MVTLLSRYITRLAEVSQFGTIPVMLLAPPRWCLRCLLRTLIKRNRTIISLCAVSPAKRLGFEIAEGLRWRSDRKSVV